tara:strand:- start:700 stop:1059 length:360 start_codon:yes stop_codon:yes gene_type:complete
MASTSSKNNEGDYLLEQTGNSNFCDYLTSYKNNFGTPNVTHFAGDGLLPGRIASNNLSKNYCDIESQLFGIGTSNMVKPKQDVIPVIHNTKTLNMIDRLPTMIPEPLIIENGQRPNIRN